MSSGKYGRSSRFERGFSLLEVLISGAIMSSGLAGLAALLFTSVSGTAQSGYQTTTSMLADSMLAMSEISPASRQVFLRALPASVSSCDEHSLCSARQFSESNLKSWHFQVASRLPMGQGVVCIDSSPFDGTGDHPACDGGDLLVVKVFWQADIKLMPASARVVKIARR